MTKCTCRKWILEFHSSPNSVPLIEREEKRRKSRYLSFKIFPIDIDSLSFKRFLIDSNYVCVCVHASTFCCRIICLLRKTGREGV